MLFSAARVKHTHPKHHQSGGSFAAGAAASAARWDHIDGPPFFGGNEAELRDCADTIMDTAVGLFATIDGMAVQNLDSYRVRSPLYESARLIYSGRPIFFRKTG